MDVLLANPRGFCAGVDRAIAIVEQALAKYGAPIYVRHEVVHNRFVVDDLKAKGAVFVEDLDEVPAGSTVVFSAHGVPKSVRAEAEARGLRVFDATCPLVTKVHAEVAKMRAQGREIVMIGHAGHPEVEGTMGQCDGGIHLVESVADVERLDGRVRRRAGLRDADHAVGGRCGRHRRALKRRFPRIVGPKKDDICYATQNRQDAVKFMAPQADVVIVVGSPNSSNSNRLREVAANRGVPAYMIDRARRSCSPSGSPARPPSASRPARRRPRCWCRRSLPGLPELGARDVRELDGVAERIVFPLPKGLRISTGRPQSTSSAGASVRLRRRRGTTRVAPPARPAPAPWPSRRRRACRPGSVSARTMPSPA